MIDITVEADYYEIYLKDMLAAASLTQQYAGWITD